jgi:hypothetical protein
MAARSRTFGWPDPALITAHLGRRSGLEMLRAIGAGELPTPPVMYLLDVGGLDVDEGRAVVVMTPQEFHHNSLGTVHGGSLQRCWTRPPGARSSPRFRPGSATPRWT